MKQLIGRRANVSGGFVTISVMIVILLITYACYQFVAAALNEHRATAGHADRAQLEFCVDSAEQLLLAERGSLELRSDAGLRGDTSLPEQRYANVSVGGDPTSSRQSRFTVIGRPVGREGAEFLQYGPTNESARLSIGVLPEWERRRAGTGLAALAALPGVDAELAADLLAFLQGETNSIDGAAVWQGAALDELLQVPGMSDLILFGADRNRNGFVSSWETSFNEAGAGAAPDDNRRRESSAPLAAYLAPYSAERNVNRYGQPRIFVNMVDLDRLEQALADRLPTPWVDFILAYRRNGPVAALTEETPTAAQHPIASLYDLIGATVAMPGADGELQELSSPFVADQGAYRDYLLKMADELTVDARVVIPGRININLAPAAVLRAIPGADQQLVDRIVAAREQPGIDLANMRYHAAWLVAGGWIEPAWMRELDPYITTRGDVVRAQIVGFYAAGKAAAYPSADFDEQPLVRREIVVDAARAEPRVVFRHDLSNLGRGYTREALTP